VPEAAPQIDLLDADFYVHGAREAYAWMRRNAPVFRDTKNDVWGIATYDGVRAAEGNAAVFSNAGGSRPDTGPLPWMMDMDAPAHLKRRKLVNRAFTPARVRDSAPRIRAICDDLIDAVCEQGQCDFRHDLAAPLPLIVICDLLGFPPEDRAMLLHWSDEMLGSLNGGPEALEAAAASFTDYIAYAHGVIAGRRAEPAADLVSVLVHAEVDGERLEDDELVFEILLLLLGGDETTRNVTCGGMEQLLLHPASRQRLATDPSLLPGAVEEMLRWVSPIKNMNRTVTGEFEFGGQRLRGGDKVLLLYESANFDATQFDEPDRFDIERSPNDHVAFGFGAHFCLGASLARLELCAIFERLLARLPDLELATGAPPPRALTGISEMPVRFTPAARVTA
jgi:cytochrome P450 family 142 subfamily A polypeptide 1